MDGCPARRGLLHIWMHTRWTGSMLQQYIQKKALKHECGANQRISSSDWIEIISDTTIMMPYLAGDVYIEHKSTVDDTLHVPANII